MEVRSRRARETSPDRAKVCMKPRVKPMKKVQIVYYLSRNGQLEHPHYMEVTHLANHPLRLKDVIDRLTVLRGKGMPSLYSWSCKRSYKNGFVWNDLVENDIVYPSDGAEYVLKGSELLEGCSEKFQQLHVSSRRQQQPIIQETSYLHLKRKPLTQSLEEAAEKTTYEHQYHHHQEYQEDDYDQEDEEKTSYTSSTTPHSRCSRGVSTDELDDQEPHNNNSRGITDEFRKLDSTIEVRPNLRGIADNIPNIKNPTTESSTSSILSRENPNQINNNTSKRFEDGDPVIATESVRSRNSVLIQLISCGNLAVARSKNMPSTPVMKKSINNENLYKGVLCKSAVKVAEEEDMMITFMSENPRFGNFQSQEKEYFSGSIVESATKDQAEIQPVLKKSNSYNEERSSKAGLREAILEAEEEKKIDYGVKGKCIPRMKSSSSSKKIRK